jgi:hypothetical protein
LSSKKLAQRPTLPVTGTYAVVVDPQSAATGAMTLALG